MEQQPSPGARRQDDVSVALSAAIDAAQAAPWWRSSDADVRAAVVSLDQQAARLDAARARLLAEADGRDVGSASGAATTAAWLAGVTGSRPEQAARRVTVSVALQGALAATGAALAAGAITFDHAVVVHDTVRRLGDAVDPTTADEVEACLLRSAADHDEDGARVPGLDPRRLARLGRAVRHRLDPDAGERLARAEDAAEALRCLTCVETDDGMWWLRGVLDGKAGAELRSALDARNAPRPAGEDGSTDLRPRSRRDADALVTIVDEWRASAPSGAAARPALVVTATAETLAAAPGTAGVEPATTTGGLVLSAATAQVLGCDAAVTPALLAPDGAPLDVGRTRYTFPDRVRAAVLLRDGHACTRCGRADLPLQLHHLRTWAAGGPTSECNGTAVCPPCHRSVHRQGWTGELAGTRVIWHPPGRSPPHLPPGAWRPALTELVSRWLSRRAA